jgi:DGQHR domain-containing protein
VTKVVDPDPVRIEIDALKVTQPIGDLFVASIEHDVLCKISYFDVRRVLQERRDVERYLGIQRPLVPRRVADLEDYVNFVDATFPSSIILAIDDEYASYDAKREKLTLRNYKEGESSPSIAISEIARVLDGQHRIAGLANFKGPLFGLPVTIFIGSDIADQAYIFSTVNLEQTKVSKSLVYDLFELARTRSPQKTCHNIAVALDRDEKSPFYQRIKRLGFATQDRKFETLTQATFVEGVLPLVSDEPKKDRDLLLRGEKLTKVRDAEAKRLIFRNMFIDAKDLDIAKIIHNYFDSVRQRWEKALACTRFRRHRVRCFDGTGGVSWRDGSLHGSSSLRRCG